MLGHIVSLFYYFQSYRRSSTCTCSWAGQLSHFNLNNLRKKKKSLQTLKQSLAVLSGEAASRPQWYLIIYMAITLENFSNWCKWNSGQVFQSPKQLASFNHRSAARGAVMRDSQCSRGLCFSQREHISLNSLAEIGPPDGISASLPTVDYDPLLVIYPL